MRTVRRDRARGQTLALFSLTALLITLMVLMTISFGMQAARKADLNNAADATAYAAAVSTARTFNTAALLNRAIIAHYVTMAGIEAQMAYISDGHNAFNLAANFFRMMDMTGNPVRLADAFPGLNNPSGRCDAVTWETRDASYEMWHASLFYMSPGPPPAHSGDNVDGYCNYHVSTTLCTRRRPFARGDGWNWENLATLEHRATDELKAAHTAIHDLTKIQRSTYRELRRQVGNGNLAEDIAGAAKIRSGLVVEAGQQAKSELDSATRSTDGNAYTQRWRGFEEGFANAIMGTRPRERLSLQQAQARSDNFAPLFRQLRDFATAAFQAYPEQPFAVSFTEPDVMSDYTWGIQDNTPSIPKRFEEPMVNVQDLEPGMGFSYGRTQGGTVTVMYRDACAGRTPRYIRSGVPLSGPDPVTNQRYETLPMGVNVRSSGSAGVHQGYSSEHLDGMHWTESNGIGPMGCHGRHGHYASTNVTGEHMLEHETLPEEILAYVLADPAGLDGAHGIWGQPVVPVFLTRSFPLASDPWAQKFHFGFTQRGSDFDMQKADVMTASAAGVAHYHRREHLGEPPNLLNPFWRATLQPLEVDGRPRRFDPTAATRLPPNRMPMMDILRSDVPQYRDRRDARDAYDALRNQVHGMQRQPGDGNGVVR